MPSASAAAQRSQVSVFLSSTSSTSAVEVFPVDTAVPAAVKLTASVSSAKGFLQLLVAKAGAAPQPVADLVFDTNDKTQVRIRRLPSRAGGLMICCGRWY